MDPKQAELMSHDSVATIEFGNNKFSKLKFSLHNTYSLQDSLTLVYNESYGIRVLNGIAGSESDVYKDIDMQLGSKSNKIVVMTYRSRVYIALNQMTKANLVYEGEFPSEFIQDQFSVKVDHHYTTE
jgi:hypothetical protein